MVAYVRGWLDICETKERKNDKKKSEYRARKEKNRKQEDEDCLFLRENVSFTYEDCLARGEKLGKVHGARDRRTSIHHPSTSSAAHPTTALALADELQQSLAEIAAGVVLDLVNKRDAVFASEDLLDGAEVNLRALHQGVDQDEVVRAQTLHRLVELVGKHLCRVAGKVADGEQTRAEVAGSLANDGVANVVFEALDVVHKDHAQMSKTALREDLNELGLVCAEPALAGFVESLGVSSCLLLVDYTGRSPLALKDGEQQRAVVAAGVLQNIALKLAAGVGALVGLLQLDDLRALLGAEHLNEKRVVRTEALQALHEEVAVAVLRLADKRLEKRGEIARRVALNVLLEVAREELAVVLADGHALLLSAAAQNVDECVLVGAQALHGLAQGVGVGLRVEGLWQNEAADDRACPLALHALCVGLGFDVRQVAAVAGGRAHSAWLGAGRAGRSAAAAADRTAARLGAGADGAKAGRSVVAELLRVCAGSLRAALPVGRIGALLLVDGVKVRGDAWAARALVARLGRLGRAFARLLAADGSNVAGEVRAAARPLQREHAILKHALEDLVLGALEHLADRGGRVAAVLAHVLVCVVEGVLALVLAGVLADPDKDFRRGVKDEDVVGLQGGALDVGALAHDVELE
eukprot:m.113164 g.113164  ORF g.113164 m.113164 type:complete len:638 (+) comp15992_c0_seq3:87-2000(+)